MKFHIASLATLAAVAAADTLFVTEICLIGCTATGTFVTDYGRYTVNANEGCRSTSVPGMTDFCIDWGNQRGHFKFSHQNYKRCLVVTKTEYVECGANTCWESIFSERPCTWREGDVEEIEGAATVSATAAETEDTGVFDDVDNVHDTKASE